jgi:hypothetical protein
MRRLCAGEVSVATGVFHSRFRTRPPKAEIDLRMTLRKSWLAMAKQPPLS